MKTLDNTKNASKRERDGERERQRERRLQREKRVSKRLLVSVQLHRRSLCMRAINQEGKPRCQSKGQGSRSGVGWVSLRVDEVGGVEGEGRGANAIMAH